MHLQTPQRRPRGRPRNDPNFIIRQGVVVQLIQARIPRELHRQMKLEAKAANVTLTRWILETCNREIERKQKQTATNGN
jgi:HicB family